VSKEPLFGVVSLFKRKTDPINKKTGRSFMHPPVLI
jgi:hypothetical protein